MQPGGSEELSPGCFFALICQRFHSIVALLLL
jgi:hypothetical protein